jgi:hypothetical protein
VRGLLLSRDAEQNTDREDLHHSPSFILPRYTQPSPHTKLLIEKLRLELPNQPLPCLVAQKQSNEIEV